jgi:hypothetical protein
MLVFAAAMVGQAAAGAKAEKGTDTSALITFAVGAAGAIVGGIFSLIGSIYTQRRGTNAVRRWIFQNHFDLFQDVADCACKYYETETFGAFHDRVVAALKVLRESLEKDSTGGLANKEYASIYRSLSSVEYMIWALDHGFEPEHMRPYIDKCLDGMREAQHTLGPWPATRPNAALDFLQGTAKLTGAAKPVDLPEYDAFKAGR